MRKWVALQLVVIAVTAHTAMAQEVRGRGSEAITLGATDGSARIGYWHKLSDANSIGGDFAIDFSDNNRGDGQSYQFNPGIRHYLMPEKAVSPYLYGALTARYGTYGYDNGNSKSSSEVYAAGLEGGIGLEWFPIQSVSIAGHVGVTAEYEKARSRSSYTSNFDNSTSTTSRRDEGVHVGTFNSGILVNLYF